MRLDAFLASGLEERLKPFVPERFDHGELLTVKHRLSGWQSEKSRVAPLRHASDHKHFLYSRIENFD